LDGHGNYDPPIVGIVAVGVVDVAAADADADADDAAAASAKVDLESAPEVRPVRVRHAHGERGGLAAHRHPLHVQSRGIETQGGDRGGGGEKLDVVRRVGEELALVEIHDGIPRQMRHSRLVGVREGGRIAGHGRLLRK